MSRFDYVKYDAATAENQDALKSLCLLLEREIDVRMESPRAKKLALTALEVCYMWIGKGLRDDQITKNGSAELQEDRKNG